LNKKVTGWYPLSQSKRNPTGSGNSMILLLVLAHTTHIQIKINLSISE